MLTRKVTVGTSETNLKALLETAGVTFPNDNNKCNGLIIQIDPAELDGTVEVLDDTASAGEGITLTNLDDTQPSSIAFRVDRIDRVLLVGSAASIDVRVLVEQD